MKKNEGTLSLLCHYLLAAWLPLVSIVPRSAAWFAPSIILTSRPRLTRCVWSWLFVAWALCTICWAPEPMRALRVAACIGLFLLVYPTRVWNFSSKKTIQSAFAACCFMMIMVWQHDGSVRSIAQTYAPVALTFSLACATQPTWLFIAISFLVGWVADCDTALLATAGISIARYIPLSWLKKIWKAMWVIVIAALCMLRNASDDQIQSFGRMCYHFSYVHRGFIYRGVAKIIDESPLLVKFTGQGLDASRFVEDEMLEFESFRHDGGIYRGKTIPTHPHNIVLQIALELGFVGLALAMIGVWNIPFHNRRQISVAYVAAAQGLISVGAWQTWWMASVWLAYWLASQEAIEA